MEPSADFFAPSSAPALPPIEQKPPFVYRAAKYSVTVLLVAVGLNLLNQFSQPPGSAMGTAGFVLSLIGGALFLSAVPAGIIALCGIPKHGCRYLLWRGLVGVLVSVLLIAIAASAFLKVRTLAGEIAFQSAAKSINRDAPKMIDESTRLDKAVAGPGKLLTIYIMLTSVKLADLDMNHWKTQVRPQLKAGNLETPLVKILGTGGTITYRYADSEGVKIDEISLTAQDLPITAEDLPQSTP